MNTQPRTAAAVVVTVVGAGVLPRGEEVWGAESKISPSLHCFDADSRISQSHI